MQTCTVSINQMVKRHRKIRCGSKRSGHSLHKIHPHLPLMPGPQLAAEAAVKDIFYQAIGRFGNIDPPCLAVLFHAGAVFTVSPRMS